MDQPTQWSHIFMRSAIDLQGNDSLAKIVWPIQLGSTVIDIGCGVGILGQP